MCEKVPDKTALLIFLYPNSNVRKKIVMVLVDMTGSGWTLRDNVKNNLVQGPLTPLHSEQEVIECWYLLHLYLFF